MFSTASSKCRTDTHNVCHISQAETSIAAGNAIYASDKLGLAIAKLSNLIGEITSIRRGSSTGPNFRGSSRPLPITLLIPNTIMLTSDMSSSFLYSRN